MTVDKGIVEIKMESAILLVDHSKLEQMENANANKVTIKDLMVLVFASNALLDTRGILKEDSAIQFVQDLMKY